MMRGLRYRSGRESPFRENNVLWAASEQRFAGAAILPIGAGLRSGNAWMRFRDFVVGWFSSRFRHTTSAVAWREGAGDLSEGTPYTSLTGSSVATSPKLRAADPIAGATQTIGVSPAPADGMSLRSSSTISMTGMSLNRGTG